MTMSHGRDSGQAKWLSSGRPITIHDLVMFDQQLNKHESRAFDGNASPWPAVGCSCLPTEPTTLDLSTKKSASNVVKTESSSKYGARHSASADVLQTYRQSTTSQMPVYRAPPSALLERKSEPRTGAAEHVNSAVRPIVAVADGRPPRALGAPNMPQHHPDLSDGAGALLSPASALSTAALLAHEVRLLAHPYLGGGTAAKEAAAAAGTVLAQQFIPRHHVQRHHKAISRTQSAPLPAMSMLQPLPHHTFVEHQQLVKQHQEKVAKEHQKKLVIEQLRHTLLQRSSIGDHPEYGGEGTQHQVSATPDFNFTTMSRNSAILPYLKIMAPELPLPITDYLHVPSHGYFGPHPRFDCVGWGRPSELRYLARTRSSPLASYNTAATTAAAVAESEPQIAPLSLVTRPRPASSSSAAAEAAASSSVAPAAAVVSASAAVATAVATLPSNAVVLSSAPLTAAGKADARSTCRTALAYDVAMLPHECLCHGSEAIHHEAMDRTRCIYGHLKAVGLVNKCHLIKSSSARTDQLQPCHSQSNTELLRSNMLNRKDVGGGSLGSRSTKLACGGSGMSDDTTAWNEQHVAEACRLAVGSVAELASLVATGIFDNGMAIVRPSGHHAEHGRATGLPYFNAAAVAAKYIQEKHSLQRVMILDWNIHHGNDTQQATHTDPSILYMSLHRHDHGTFFTGTGAPENCGEKRGLGFNVNIAFSSSHHEPMGDAEYMAAFRSLVMPIAQDFNPQIVLVICGFDAADGHAYSVGGYKLSPECFGYMTKQLMSLPSSRGKVVLVLEEGYNLQAMCSASELCVRALLGEEVSQVNAVELQRKPCSPIVHSLQKCITIQSRYWPSVMQHYQSAQMSHLEATMLRLAHRATYIGAQPAATLLCPGACSTPCSSRACEPMDEA